MHVTAIGEVVVAALFDDIVALGNDAVLQDRLLMCAVHRPQDTLVQRTPLVLVDVILPVARSISQARRTLGPPFLALGALGLADESEACLVLALHAGDGEAARREAGGGTISASTTS